MKLFLQLLALISFLSIWTSCDKNSTTPEYNNIEQEQEKEYSIVGVWRSDNYFISIDSDSFLSAYIAPKFLDCGKVTKSGKEVTCKNSYFNRTTTYSINSLDDKEMKVTIAYQEIEGDKKSTTLTLNKTSDEPAIQENSLIGHNYRFMHLSAYTTIEFNTYSLAKMTNTKSNIKDVPLTLHYIYIGDKIYFQRFNPEGGRVGMIGGWNENADDGTITVYKLSFEGSQIYNHEDVTSSVL